MYKREVLKLNKENFSSWKYQMKLHLSSIGDDVTYCLENEYTTPSSPLTIEKMNEKKNHNSPMIDISSSLNDVEFDDI